MEAAHNTIGLNQDKATELAQGLNQLLADLQVHYQNLRGFHWNIKGPSFFELHLKFEALYTEVQVFIDDVAERILTLGHRPLHTFSAFLKHAQVKESPDKDNADACVKAYLEDLKVLMTLKRKLIELADGMNDEGSSSLLSDQLRIEEKNAWMFAAYSGRRV